MGGSGVQRPLKIGKYLAKEGIEVTFLVPKVASYHISDPSLLDELEDVSDRIRIIRVGKGAPSHSALRNWIFSHYRTLLSRLVTWMTSWFYLPDNKKSWIKPALESALDAHQRTPFDIVFATASPYSNLLLAAELKNVLKVPVIMDLRDDWLHSHLLSYPTKWHYIRMAALEKRILQTADEITVINRGVQKSIQDRLSFGVIPKVLSNGFDPEDFDATSASLTTEKRALFPEDKFHILYNGLFYGAQQPDSFLQGVLLAVKRKPILRSILCLHFQGDYFQRHENLADRLTLTNMIRIHGNLPHKESVAGLQLADLLWVIVPNQSYSEAHTPGKLFEYFGSLKPVLGLVGKGVTKELLQQYGACYFGNPDDPETIADAILQAYEDWKTNQQPVGNREFIQQFDRASQGKYIHHWILELLAGTRVDATSDK